MTRAPAPMRPAGGDLCVVLRFLYRIRASVQWERCSELMLEICRLFVGIFLFFSRRCFFFLSSFLSFCQGSFLSLNCSAFLGGITWGRLAWWNGRNSAPPFLRCTFALGGANDVKEMMNNNEQRMNNPSKKWKPMIVKHLEQELRKKQKQPTLSMYFKWESDGTFVTWDDIVKWKPFPAIQLMASGCQSALGVQQSSAEASGAAMAGRVRRRVLSQ